MMDLPTVADIRAAAGRLAGQAVRTRLLPAPEFSRRVGVPVLVKPEMLQRTGSFKFRGAFNRICQIPAGDRSRGVLAWSSGNHAQGVAHAAQLMNIPATIVMPADAPAIKLKNTERYGATLVTHDRRTQSREAIGRDRAAQTGATLVPPYDHREIIAGQGTVGLEIAEDCLAMGLAPESVLVPCGGGGLVGGIALALESELPGARVISVEPEGYDDTARSLRSGRREQCDLSRPSMCDALLAPSPGELTFEINRRLLSDGLAVPEGAVLEAMALAAQDLRVVVEPGGAVGLAALLSGAHGGRGGPIVVVCSGGNVDRAVLARALA